MSDKAEPIFVQKLRKPLNAGAETITELSLREPRAGDMLRCGNPVKYMPHDETQEINFDEPKLLRMIAALSGVHQPIIEQMSPNDLIECAWAIAPFFLPGMRRASATS